MRLDKYLSNAGYGSRSEIRKLIKRGIVSVDKICCTNPSKKVDSKTIITLDGDQTTSTPMSTIMMNKPKGYVSSNEIEGGYPCVMELIHPPHPTYAIAGRLDVDSRGLLILSTQGELVHSIISPTKEVSKLYKAVVIDFDPEETHRFYEGIEITRDFKTKPVTFFEITDISQGLCTIYLGITEGKFHQVKKMFQMVGSEVIELERMAIGSLRLNKSLNPGEYREITECEKELLFHPPQSRDAFYMLK